MNAIVIHQDLVAQLAFEREENERLRAALVNRKAGGSMKVTEKGGVSVYGLGRFPVTLYKSQWDNLFARMDEIKAFLKANEARLATKD